MNWTGKPLPVRRTLIVGLAALLALAVDTSAHAVTFTVNSLADTGTPEICTLRDALRAAGGRKPVNGCPSAFDSPVATIVFSVTGTIKLVSGQLGAGGVRELTIIGPPGGITIDAGKRSRILRSNGTALNLQNLNFVNGLTNNGDDGGAILIEDAPVTVDKCTFSDDVATKVRTFGGFGGAIASKTRDRFIRTSRALTIVGSTFTNDKASDVGGAIYHQNGLGASLTIDWSTFTNNQAGLGGAIFEVGSNEFDKMITNSTFSGNSATGEGGAISHNSGRLTVINSTFSGNSARDGSGIFNNGGRTTVTNSTFSGNTNSMSSGVVAKATTLINSLLADNNGGNCAGSANGGNNISDDGSCRFGSTTGANGQTIGDNVMDAGLDPAGLRNNGGPTATIALLASSIAINAIPIRSCPATDQRAFKRPGKSANVPACDVGAFEFGALATALPQTAFCDVLLNGNVTRTAADGSKCTATAGPGSAISQATGGPAGKSEANANATGSLFESSAASAQAENGSKADAIVHDGASGDAVALDSSKATAESRFAGDAHAQAQHGSTSSALANLIGFASAEADADSEATAEALDDEFNRRSNADAIALNHSKATATGQGGGQAEAVADDHSIATAVADCPSGFGSVSAKAQHGATAEGSCTSPPVCEHGIRGTATVRSPAGNCDSRSPS